MYKFLKNFELSKYGPVLIKAGLEDLQIIHDFRLSYDSIDEIINDIISIDYVNIKGNDIKKFKDAINVVLNGKYEN